MKDSEIKQLALGINAELDSHLPEIKPINDRMLALIQLKTIDGRWVLAELREAANGENLTIYAVQTTD